MTGNVDRTERPPPDAELRDIASYVGDYVVDSDEAYDTARNCLLARPVAAVRACLKGHFAGMPEPTHGGLSWPAGPASLLHG